MAKKARKRIIQSLHDVPGLRGTIERLSAEGRLNKEHVDHVHSHLEEWVADSKYILLNLGAHLSIGLLRFTTIPLPLPIGSTVRGLWVIGNRIYCDIKWDMHRKQVHSMLVLLVAIIPFLGYFAYTIPLKKKSEYLTYLYAEHISYMMYGKAFEEKLAKTPGFIRRIGYALLVPEEYREK